MNFALTCPMRGALALVTLPKVPLLMFPLGLLNWAWLKMLKNSPRIRKDFDSVRGIAFCSPRSVLLKPGPWKKRRLAVPKVPHSGLGTPALKVQLVPVNEL